MQRMTLKSFVLGRFCVCACDSDLCVSLPWQLSGAISSTGTSEQREDAARPRGALGVPAPVCLSPPSAGRLAHAHSGQVAGPPRLALLLESVILCGRLSLRPSPPSREPPPSGPLCPGGTAAAVALLLTPEVLLVCPRIGCGLPSLLLAFLSGRGWAVEWRWFTAPDGDWEARAAAETLVSSPGVSVSVRREALCFPLYEKQFERAAV